MPKSPMSEVDRVERRLHRVMAARPRDHAACAAVLEEAVTLTRTVAVGAKTFYLDELLGELAETYAAMGRFNEALEAIREAVDAGLGGQPDARCRIAEILMRAGRVSEAEPIWAQVRRDTPDDVWLYNNAGIEYADVGEHATALDWLTDGLRLALGTGDPERLVAQLAGWRGECLAALDLAPDDLQTEADQFQAAREQRDRQQREFRATAQSADDVVVPGPMPLTVAWSWFPADEYEQARAQWPGLTEPGGLAEGGRAHPEYCRALQAKLIDAAEAGMTGIRIAPIRVADLLAWCAEKDMDPERARADYAAHLAHTAPERLISWPPGRNEACWCASTRKYKKCCGAPAGTG